MRLLFHIGAPKTGSTSIQEALFDSQETLRRSGYHVMCSREPSADAMQRATERLGGHRGAPSSRRRHGLDDELAFARHHACHTIIASDEAAFIGAGAEHLLDIVPDDVEVHMLAYLRPQEEWIARVITQNLRTVRNAGRSAEAALEMLTHSGQGDFHMRLSALMKHPRSGTLHVYRLSDAGGDVVQHFAARVAAIGGAALDLPARRANVSPRAENLSLLSLLDRPRHLQTDLRLRYSPRVVIAQSIALHPLGPRVEHLPDALKASVRRTFRASNHLLHQQFDVDLEAELPPLDAPAYPESPVTRPWSDDVSLDGMVLLLHALLRTAFEIWNVEERTWTPLDDEHDHTLIREGQTLAGSLCAADELALATVHRLLLSVDGDSLTTGESGCTLSRRLMSILGDWRSDSIAPLAASVHTVPPTAQRFGQDALRVVMAAGLQLQYELMEPGGPAWQFQPHDPELEFIRSPWVI